MKITNKEAIADSGKYIRRKGTDADFATRILLFTGEDESSFEETDTLPRPQEQVATAERDAAIAALIRHRYPEDDEFAIQRKAIATLMEISGNSGNSDLSEFADYNRFAETCKAEVDARIAAEAENPENSEI